MIPKQMPLRLRKYMKKNDKRILIFPVERNRDKPIENFRIDVDVIYNRTLYILSNINGGGTLKYFKDMTLICNFLNINVVLISNGKQLIYYQNLVTSSDLVLLQQVLQPTDITQDTIIHFLNDLPKECCVFTTIHDNYYMNNPDYQLTDHLLHEPDNTYKDPPQTFPYSRVEHIICPSNYILEHFQKYFYHPSICIVPHPDKLDLQPLFIPPITDNIINIGIITLMTPCKGVEYFEKLFQLKNKQFKIVYHVYSNYLQTFNNVHVHGSYTEDDIYEQLVTDKIHGLVFFNKWAETYSYALSKGINSGLPIYYTPIGAIHERLSFFDNDRFHPHDLDDYFLKFDLFLHYIFQNQGTDNNNFINKKTLSITIPLYYKKLLTKTTPQYNLETIHEQIKPFCIYFPQFHSTTENDYNYYKNYTDITALYSCKEEDADFIHP